MGVILPGVERDGIFMGLGREEIHFCGSGMGEVWEFTPVSPSNTDTATFPTKHERTYINFFEKKGYFV